MILLEKCPLCKSSKIVKYLDSVDFSASKELFTIVSCETCAFLFTNPRPYEKDLEKYYKSDTYISHTNKKEGFLNFLYQKIRYYTIKNKVALLKKVSDSGPVHLDIGCGTGEFLNACKKEGFLVTGVEPSDLARKQAVKNYSLSVFKDSTLSRFEEKSIDSVTMWHVLEHVPNINETLSNISRILKKRGVVIVGVPNHKSWDAFYYKKYWAAWDLPIHLSHFSEDTISLFFKNNDFKLIAKHPMIFDAFYVALLSQGFKYGRKNILLAFIIGFISNIFGLLSNRGYSSMIYIFKKQD